MTFSSRWIEPGSKRLIRSTKCAVHIQVCVEDILSGICVWNTSVGEHELRAQKEASTVFSPFGKQ